MSAPDNPTSKAPPSLLADKPANASSAQPNGSRILANLEGRVVPPPARARPAGRARWMLGCAALLLIAAGGFGAWHLSGRAPSVAPVTTLAHDAPAVAAKPASAPPPAPVQQAATIIAEDDTADGKPAAGTVAPATTGDDSRLSRALADGAQDAGATAGAGAGTAVNNRAGDSARHTAPASRTKAPAAASRKPANVPSSTRREAKGAHPGATTVQAKKSREARRGAKNDDSDADLLAVLVARTRPADAKPDAKTGAKSGTKPGTKPGTNPGAARAAKNAAAGNPSLAQQVKACGDRGFFEDQLCRWRVCDGYWGKDPACPSASRPNGDH